MDFTTEIGARGLRAQVSRRRDLDTRVCVCVFCKNVHYAEESKFFISFENEENYRGFLDLYIFSFSLTELNMYYVYTDLLKCLSVLFCNIS